MATFSTDGAFGTYGKAKYHKEQNHNEKNHHGRRTGKFYCDNMIDYNTHIIDTPKTKHSKSYTF